MVLTFLRARGRKVSRSLPRRILAILIVSGVMIGVNWILMFEAYNYTTIPTATLCYYMEPTIVVLLSPVFFKEKLTLKKLVCAAAAFIGMVLVSGAADEGLPHGDTLLGILFSLAAAVLYSGVVILNKGSKGTVLLFRNKHGDGNKRTVPIDCYLIAPAGTRHGAKMSTR